ncbi:hypothetical protein NL487_29125, partial [Klebsiella pneumoniae]|nr:hypothetical protein [Klebsiella pneumoniae]
IELMGGRLTVRSTPGQGSIFTVSLSLPRGAAAEAPPASLAPEARATITRALAGAATTERLSEPTPEAAASPSAPAPAPAS